MPTLTATPSGNLRLSDLAPHFVQSEIRAMTVACSDARGINMAQGVCDTDPPHPVVEAAIEAIRSGHNIYTRLDGIAPLREAIAQKLASFNKLDVDPRTQVLVTSGATGAMNAALLALLNAGDECIVLEPFYGYHVSTLRAMRAVPVVVPLELELELELAVEVLVLAWGVRPNDCGRVMPRLRTLSRLTSRTATSTTTSGRARSRSFSSF